MNATATSNQPSPSTTSTYKVNPFGALSSRLDLARLLDQRHRLMQVHTALPELSMIPESMVLRDAVSQPFELELRCLSTSAHLELKTLLGEQISLKLLRSDGQYLPWHGYVHSAAQIGSNGGLARYALTMRPWFLALALRRNSRVFHDQTAQQVIEAVFADHHPQAHWRFETTQAQRVRSLCTQYRETDLAFVQRLLASEGLAYHFEHLDGQAASDADAAAHARHVMVITDRSAERTALGTVCFTSQHATASLREQRDSITAFMAQRHLASNAASLGGWDYKRLQGVAAESQTTLAIGSLPTLEVYDGAGTYRFEGPEHAERAAALALAALELDFKRFEGQGSARHFEAGRCFKLIDHPLYGANNSAFNYAGADTASHRRSSHEEHNAFVLLAVEHYCANNLGADLAALLGNTDIEHGTYKNHFHCAPVAAALVPRHVPKPTAPGVQSALVVGHSEEAVQTERDHRVKLRFAWQDHSLGTGSDHAVGDWPANAPGTWVRVALPWAGANWGASMVPRVGTEVAVEFIDGDIDRPVVVGALHNGADVPPFAAGVDAGTNHSGVISGWHTHGLDSSAGSTQHNQWALDDATGQLRMRLSCSSTQAELGLGHLIAQPLSSAQRGSWRGVGFEASTQGWSTLRAAQGILISTSPRAGSYGSAQSTQMDAGEALAQLKSATDLGQRLSASAAQGEAQALLAHEAGSSVAQMIEHIDPEQKSKLEGAPNGHRALFDPAGGREGSTPVPQFAQPVMLLDTPASASLLSDAGVAQYTAEDLSWVTQKDAQLSAAHTAACVSAQTSSLYTHAGGIQFKAANGPLSLRAHTDALQLLASQDIRIVSVKSEITVSAKSKIALIGADSGITLEGANITFTTPGTWRAKGTLKTFNGAGSRAASLPRLPNSKVQLFDEALKYTDPMGQPLTGLPFKITASDGMVEGVSEADGMTARTATESTESLKFEIRWHDLDA